jgi:hypothetical protein
MVEWQSALAHIPLQKGRRMRIRNMPGSCPFRVGDYVYYEWDFRDQGPSIITKVLAVRNRPNSKHFYLDSEYVCDGRRVTWWVNIQDPEYCGIRRAKSETEE